MTQINAIFQKKAVFIAYLMAGDGGIQRTLSAMCALVAGGVDIIELGIPFTDPIADGPIIQSAAARALASGTTVNHALELVRQFRQYSDVPIVLFSYFNPLLAASKNNIFECAHDVGVNGILIVDLPIEETDAYVTTCEQYAIDPIFIVTPVTPIPRVKQIAALTKGFLYYACRKGTTGFRHAMPENFSTSVSTMKSASSLPLVAGFGITQRSMAELALQHADGFVVGSLFVDALAKGMNPSELTQLAQQIDPRKNG